MIRSFRVALMSAVFLGTALSGAVVSADELDLSNKWRIECDGSAKSDGKIVFRVTTMEGQATDVTATVNAGTRENDVAKRLRDNFKAVLDPDTYHVEVDDGEDVLVKKRKGHNFELKFVESTVENVQIRVKKE
jgi:hypothetical protein